MNTSFLLVCFFATIFGYIAGISFQKTLGKIHKPLGQCNIKKKGIQLRAWLAGILLLSGLYFGIPILTFFAGFSWYESRAKWCIAQTLK
ncbi:hypothetical protein KA057_03300 [Candidatus Gracilibacteria bacterium]|nr:hypothetical protein [Candidatus Gracilibacteria bacterium]